MSEEENKNVVEQAQQEVVQPSEAESTHSEQEVQKPDQAELKARHDQEYNWAEARRKMQEIERQNREMREQLAKIEQQKTPPTPEEDIGVKDDDLVEGRVVKDLYKKVKGLESYIKQKEVSSVDERLSIKFSDFNEIVNEENIEYLKQNEPELALTLSHNPDPYAQGVAAYKLIKKLGIGAKPERIIEKERVITNSQKPRAVQSISKASPLENVNAFYEMSADARKQYMEQARREMNECAKRA